MSFLKRNVSYEVQVNANGHWIIESLQRTEKAALAVASGLVEANQHEAVRVLMEEGDTEPQVIFEQLCDGRPTKPVTIATIDRAGLCTKLDDLYEFDARLTASRLFRQYLDREGLMAFEVLHNHWRLRGLAAEERLVLQGIHRIAGLQARQHKADQKTQVDFLFRSVTDAREWMRDLVPEKSLPKRVTVLREKGYGALGRALSKSYAPEILPRAKGAVVAALLSEAGDWGGKLEIILKLLKFKDKGFEPFADELIAEIVDGAEAIKEILGPQKDLASALITITRLTKGDLVLSSKRMQSSPLAKLNAAMDDYHLPKTAGVLLTRVAKGLGGIKPLTKETDVQDKAAFQTLTRALMDEAGFAGGGTIAEAVTKRTRIIQGTDGMDLSPERAVSVCLGFFKSKAARLGYLLELSGTSFGAQNRADILKQIFVLVQGLKTFSDLMPAKSNEATFKLCAELLGQRVENSVLPAEIGQLIRLKLDDLLALGGSTKSTPKKKTVPPCKPVSDPLAGHDFPDNLPVSELEQGLLRRKVRKGGYIFKQGDPGDEAYLVASGSVEIICKRGRKNEVLGIVERGEIFGEMALIDHQPRMASARAADNCILTVIPIEDFQSRIGRIAELDRMIPKLLELFAQRLRVRSVVSDNRTETDCRD